MEVVVDVQQFADLIPKLAKATGKTLADVVKQQARLLLRGSGGGRDEGLIPYTPPAEDQGGQKMQNAVVERDIRRVFVTKGTASQIIKRSGVRGAGIAFNRYIKSNNLKKAIALLNGRLDKTVNAKGYTRQQKGKAVKVKSYSQTRSVEISLNNARLGKITTAQQNPNRAVHKSRQRGERTFVGGKQWSQLVLDNGSLAQYIKARQRNVGTLKAGWRPAADALGITGLPKYVKSAPHANGSFNADLQGDNPSVTLINSARTINRQLNSVLGRALEGRRIRMAADLKNKLAAALAKT